MKKTLLGTLVVSALALLSVQANAENLQTIYQLATKKDPQVLKAAATRDAAKAGIDVSKARLLPQVNFRAGASHSFGDSFNNRRSFFLLSNNGQQINPVAFDGHH